ncbi:MAG: hypothetical protein HGA74_19350, partial [Deltaproteobacteria bacterium]|nr:hypothetical protein [Deltaproteobacteria bacterium]
LRTGRVAVPKDTRWHKKETALMGGAATSHTAMVDTKMATPPIRAVSFLCHRVSLGTATRPVLRAKVLTRGVKHRESARAPAKVRKLWTKSFSIIICAAEDAVTC